MKTCPPEVFWTSYHTHKPITRKNPLHFQDLVKKWRFLTNFFTSTKIFKCLVNKCWPKFFHDNKALIFPYTTLTSNFSYLLWLRKYFVLKIKYTRAPFSNNYLQIRYLVGWKSSVHQTLNLFCFSTSLNFACFEFLWNVNLEH